MIELALLPQHLQLEPGGLSRASITLHSSDVTAGDYVLEIHGLDEGWYTLSVTQLTASLGLDASGVLTLHPPLEAAQGVYPFELIAARIDDVERTARVEALLVVELDTAAPVEALPPTIVATPPVAAIQRRVAPALPRNWLVVAAVAAALLLCAGAAYALNNQRHSHTATPAPCASPGGTREGCTATPGSTTTATGSPSPTAASVVAISGTPKPSTGSLPHTTKDGTPGPAAHTTPNPITGSIPGATAGLATRYTMDPGFPGSPNHPRGEHTGIRTETTTPSGTPTDTVTDTPTVTGTATATDTPTTVFSPTVTGATETPATGATETATTVATATVPNTTTGTATRPPTFTPIPTLQPSQTATEPPLAASPTASPTAGNSPTPAEVSVQYGYDVTPDHFVLKWQSTNAINFAVDDHPAPLTGQQSYPLETHTYVMTATSPDGSQAVHVVAFVRVNECVVLVNGQRVIVPTATCLNQGSGGPTATSTPPSTVTPAATTTAVPTTVPTEAGTATAIGTATAASPATITPTSTEVLFPTDTLTPTPVPTQPPPTAVPTATSPPDTATPTPTSTPTPTETPTPSPTPTHTP